MKYYKLLLITLILSSCNGKMLDIEHNYILYLEEFGKDPVEIKDNTFKPPNKKRMYVYPRGLNSYEIRKKRYSTSDGESIELKIIITYQITNPIDFYRNDIKIKSLGFKVSWSLEKDIEKYFSLKKYEILINEIRSNKSKIDNELTKYIIENSNLTYLIDEKIEGLDIVNLQIDYDDVKNELDQRPLLERLKESMMGKS